MTDAMSVHLGDQLGAAAAELQSALSGAGLDVTGVLPRSSAAWSAIATWTVEAHGPDCDHAADGPIAPVFSRLDGSVNACASCFPPMARLEDLTGCDVCHSRRRQPKIVFVALGPWCIVAALCARCRRPRPRHRDGGGRR